MFTGLVGTVGTVIRKAMKGPGAQLTIAASGWAGVPWVLGESIAVNGVCLTLVASHEDQFSADLSRETLARTALHALAPGTRVNLERALKVGEPLGGHMVSGHVDGVATVVRLQREGEGRVLTLDIPSDLVRYVARKGSLCVDGVSLTVNTITGTQASFAIIPHTLAATTLSALEPGLTVNIEVDLIARYLERLLQGS